MLSLTLSGSLMARTKGSHPVIPVLWDLGWDICTLAVHVEGIWGLPKIVSMGALAYQV